MITLEQMKAVISLCERINIPYEYCTLYHDEKVCGHTLKILDALETNDIDEEDRWYNEN